MRDCSLWVFVIHTTIQPYKSFPEQVSIPQCPSYENCKCPHRNHTPKHENCFAIIILVCNFHISLQFSHQFAILIFWCMVPMCTFAIIIWVCNYHMCFHISLQFSCHDSISPYVRGFKLQMDSMSLWIWINSMSATVLCGRDKEKLELSKID